MTKEQLQQLAERYDAVYEKKYKSYQQSGTSRYMREAEKAEEIANACRQALTAVDDHQTALAAKMTITQWASEADRCRANGYDPGLTKALINRIISTARDRWDYKGRYQ